MTLAKTTTIIGNLSKSLARSAAVRAFATALLISPIPLVATTSPAPSQIGFSVSFGTFYDELAPYGTWHSHPRWGDVWRPRRVEADFRPYYRGHWQYTLQYGWLWVSDHEWGDIPFHYGRWVYDPFDGWLWIPGYVWSPAWVIWRSGGGYTGWFPMPPDDGFLYGGSDPYFNRWDNWDRGFGYVDWYGPSLALPSLLAFWMFVEDRRFADRDYWRYMPPRNSYTVIVNNTTNITNYVTVNNYIVNRSIDVERVERAAGRRIERVEARNVLRRNASITTVDQGSRVQDNERRNHGGNRNASARERIVALPESRARAISPPIGGGQDKDRIDRVIGPQGGRDNGKGKDVIRRDPGPDNGPGRPALGNQGPGNDRNRPNFGNGPDRPGVGNGPDIQRDRALERRGGPNGPGGPNGLGQNGPGQNQAITRQQNEGPRVELPRPQARQVAPQNEGPSQGGGGDNNRRVDRKQADEPKGAGGPGRAGPGGGPGGRRGNQDR
jgi:hypothetical protein